MPPPEERTVLRELIDQRGWRTYRDFRREFESAARRLVADGTPEVPLTVSESQFERWLAGRVERPRPGNALVLTALFGLDIGVLLSQNSQYNPQPVATVDWHDLGVEISMSAHDAIDHAGTVARAVDGNSIDQLQDDIAEAARNYPRVTPAASWAEGMRVRGAALELLDHTGRPAQKAELVRVLGETSGVLATASFDLGKVKAAAEQARSTLMYAESIGHLSLFAWAYGMLSLLRYWAGDPKRALEAVARGLQVAPAGTASVRLFAIQARALAHQGNAAGVLESAQRAYAELEAHAAPDELHDQVGGEFSFTRARLARCLASAYGTLRQPDQEIAEAETALRIYESGPAELRMPKVEAEAWTEIGHGWLLKGILDAAFDALSHALDIAPDDRVEGLTRRMFDVGTLLTRDARLSSARIGRDLLERIDTFALESAASRVPALPPGQ